MVWAPQVQADTVYTSPAAWNAAVTGATTVNFEGIAPPGGFVSLSSPPGINVGGINFQIDRGNSNGNLFVVGDGFYYSQSALTSQESTTSLNSLLVTLPSPVIAVAADVGSVDVNSTADTLTFNLSDGTSFSVTPQPPGFTTLGFVGVTTSVPIVSVEITSPSNGGGNGINMTDFSTASGTVPEIDANVMGSALTLLAGGVLVLRGRRRR
jgi:hypothetical protein